MKTMTPMTMRNWNVGVLLENEEKRRHFHQLFRHQRFEGYRTLNSTYRKRPGRREPARAQKPTPQCCPKRPCGSGSFRTPGRFPGGGAFCRRNGSCLSCSSTLQPWLLRRCALWCRFSARVIATAIRSCRNMERRRRSLRRRALPVPPPASPR